MEVKLTHIQISELAILFIAEKANISRSDVLCELYSVCDATLKKAVSNALKSKNDSYRKLFNDVHGSSVKSWQFPNSDIRLKITAYCNGDKNGLQPFKGACKVKLKVDRITSVSADQILDTIVERELLSS